MSSPPRPERVAALLVAAGTGSRFGTDRPKQFFSIAGKSVLRHAAERLAAEVDLLQPVGDAEAIAEALADIPHLSPVPGGTTRQDSVRRGLEALVAYEVDIVLVHDGARPYFAADTVSALLEALRTHPGAIPAVPVADTLKRGVDGRVEATVRRDNLFRAQTPQAFHFPLLLALHRAAPEGATDDASILEHAGHHVALVPGSEDNIKMTFPEDAVRLARILAAPMLPRVGTGFDVHVLATGRKLILCGIEVPHDQGLAGHSDADVGIHALCDAI
jgi:2-C-methyl-D-erythritol 4-phosphate cytidylyltransferase/2-C-methyl-D-erythritol 2,4-cyclodiphosphate synthase